MKSLSSFAKFEIVGENCSNFQKDKMGKVHLSCGCLSFFH